jgi:hypothetical protein
VFLACGSLGCAVFALALAAQQLQARLHPGAPPPLLVASRPVCLKRRPLRALCSSRAPCTAAQDPRNEAAYVARCSELYPLFAARHSAPRNASLSPPPPHPPRPPRPPAPPLAPLQPPSRLLDPYPGFSDFGREGAQLCFAALIVGIGAFVLPLLCGSCCACDGRRCCSCVGSRALAALLCQVLGWFGFGVFIANMSQAAAWQAAITCGCTPGGPGLDVSSSGVFGGSSALLGPQASSTTTDTPYSTSEEDGPGGSCGGRRPALLSDLYITTFGALGLFACCMALGYFWLSSMQAAQAAHDAAMRLLPLLPTARRQLPPIIVAEPYGAPRGGGSGGGDASGGGGVEMARMVVVEEPGGTMCVGTTEPVLPPPPQQEQQRFALAPAGAAALPDAAAAGEGGGGNARPLPPGFRRGRPPA